MPSHLPKPHLALSARVPGAGWVSLPPKDQPGSWGEGPGHLHLPNGQTGQMEAPARGATSSERCCTSRLSGNTGWVPGCLCPPHSWEPGQPACVMGGSGRGTPGCLLLPDFIREKKCGSQSCWAVPGEVGVPGMEEERWAGEKGVGQGPTFIHSIMEKAGGCTGVRVA